MEEKKKVRYQASPYIQGNLARQVRADEIYESFPELRQEQEAPKPRKRQQNMPETTAAPAVGFVNMVLLALTAAFLLFSSVQYLNVQSSIAETEREIRGLEKKIATLELENGYTENRIYHSVDLTRIRETAMTELGMVYPYNNQVIEYNAARKGYVRQYGVLTGDEEEGIHETILRMFMRYHVASGK